MNGREPCPTCGQLPVDRALLSERTREGLAKARQAGKRLGRPRAENAPDGAAVKELREKGRSWEQIARKLRCSSSAARRAFDRITAGKEPTATPQ
jgi:DNA invertase Pin-like site-specific DNA recombinase